MGILESFSVFWGFLTAQPHLLGIQFWVLGIPTPHMGNPTAKPFSVSWVSWNPFGIWDLGAPFNNTHPIHFSTPALIYDKAHGLHLGHEVSLGLP